MALHLVFPALRSMAPLSDDYFSLPASSNPTLSRVCFIQKRLPVFFPTLYRRVGWMAVNRLLSESDIFG